METRHEHALAVAIDALRRERAAQDEARKHESESSHREIRSRFNAAEQATAEAFKVLRAEMAENTRLTREILMQAVKTNGRVDRLETDAEGCAADRKELQTAKTRALQSIGLAGTICGLVWLFSGDEIKQRGFLNPTPAEFTRQVDAVIERRVQPTALKPQP